MKKLVIFLFMILYQPFFGQWVQKYSGSNQLNDIFCVNEDLVFAVGDNGTILKTTDGGTTWVPQTSGISDKLLKVQFANANVGYAVAENGKIIKSINGGDNWTTIVNTTSTIETDIALVNSNIIYKSSEGSLYKSVNGGSTFSLVNNGLFIRKLQFLNEMVGFAIGGITGFAKTVNGGVTWTALGCADGGPIEFTTFYFINENVGFKKCGDQLYRTIDGVQHLPQ